MANVPRRHGILTTTPGEGFGVPDTLSLGYQECGTSVGAGSAEIMQWTVRETLTRKANR